jgi:hypothetical protein
MVEVLFTTVAVLFFFINYHFKSYATFPYRDEVSTFLLMLAHIGTTIALIKMVKTFQKGYSPYFLDGWWLPICAAFDLRAILESRHGPWEAGETADYLLGMGIAGIIIGGVAFVFFMISKWRPPHATTDDDVARALLSPAPAPPARDDLEQNAAQISASVPGIVSVRFPNKFVHQPARKAE